MTAIAWDAVSPAELTGFARTLDPSLYGLTLNRFLPDRAPELRTTFKIRYRQQTRPIAAHYRAYDALGRKIIRPGYEAIEVEVPPLSVDMYLSEEDTIRLAQLRADSTLDPALESSIFDDAAMVARSILDRIEYARGQLLSTGKITFLNDYGYTDDIVMDFGVPVSPNFVNSTHDWSVPSSSTPWTDLRNLVTSFKSANNGRGPDWIITSLLNTQRLALSTETINLLTAGNVLNPVPFATPAAVDQIRGAYDIPPITVYDTSVNLNGSTTRVIPQNLLIMGVNGPDFGETLHGVTSYALKAAGNPQATGIDTSSAPGLYVAVIEEDHPPRSTMTANATALPALKDPNLLFVYDTEGA
jgi:hypothetical protein